MSSGDRLDGLRSEGDLNLSHRRRDWDRSIADESTRDLLDRDARAFLHQSLSTPCLDAIRSALGSTLESVRGHRYLDFHGNSIHHLGYGHPRVVDAVKRTLETLPFCPRRFTNEAAVLLAEKLGKLAPGRLSKVLLAPGGTSAIGIALKLARVATGRFKTISLWESFHGASLDAISIGGEAIFREGMGPLLPGCEHVPPPDPTECIWECGRTCTAKCARAIEYVLEKEKDVAAVIAETVRSTPIFPPREYWDRVRAATRRHGALLILDEIPHGLGRTGRMFTCEHYELEPDIVVVGKSLGGGVFPLAAVIARDDLDVAADRALGHYTHEKSPVACAAALAALEVIEEEGLLERARLLGERAIAQLRASIGAHPYVRDIRGLGLLLGVELCVPGSATPATDAAEAVLYGSLARGLSFKISRGSVLTLAPPLTIPEEDLDRALGIVAECVRELR
jgi:4-aminobutyrate aminotransferase